MAQFGVENLMHVPIPEPVAPAKALPTPPGDRSLFDDQLKQAQGYRTGTRPERPAQGPSAEGAAPEGKPEALEQEAADPQRQDRAAGEAEPNATVEPSQRTGAELQDEPADELQPSDELEIQDAAATATDRLVDVAAAAAVSDRVVAPLEAPAAGKSEIVSATAEEVAGIVPEATGSVAPIQVEENAGTDHADAVAPAAEPEGDSNRRVDHALADDAQAAPNDDLRQADPAPTAAEVSGHWPGREDAPTADGPHPLHRPRTAPHANGDTDAAPPTDRAAPTA